MKNKILLLINFFALIFSFQLKSADSFTNSLDPLTKQLIKLNRVGTRLKNRLKQRKEIIKNFELELEEICKRTNRTDNYILESKNILKSFFNINVTLKLKMLNILYHMIKLLDYELEIDEIRIDRNFYIKALEALTNENKIVNKFHLRLMNLEEDDYQGTIDKVTINYNFLRKLYVLYYQFIYFLLDYRVNKDLIVHPRIFREDQIDLQIVT